MLNQDGQYCYKCGRTVPYVGLGGMCSMCNEHIMNKKQEDRDYEEYKRITTGHYCERCGCRGYHSSSCLNQFLKDQ